MKISTVSLLVGSVLTSTLALSNPIVIAGGKEGGQYQRIAGNLSSVLRDYKEFRGENIPQIQSTGGSGENLELLNSGKATVAPVQADAFMWYIHKHPDALSNIEIVGTLPMKECLFVITRKDGSVTSKSDLEKKGTRIAIGNPDSGQNISWQYVTKLHPKYANVTPTEKDGIRTLNKVETGGDYGLDAYFFTFAKDVQNDYISAVNTEGKNLKFIKFNDSDLNEKLPNGKQVYEFEDAKIGTGWGDNVEVPCTSTLMVMNSNVDDKVADRIAGIMAKMANRLVGDTDTIK